MANRVIYQEKNTPPKKKCANLEDIQGYEVIADKTYIPRMGSNPSPGEIKRRMIYRTLYHIEGTTLEIIQNKDYISDPYMPRGSSEDKVVWRPREFNFLGERRRIEDIVDALSEKGTELRLQTNNES